MGADESVYLNSKPTTADIPQQHTWAEPIDQFDDPIPWRAALEHLIDQRMFGDDNTRLAVGVCMKSRGRPYSEWADACRRGGSTISPHYSEDRWESFPATDADWSPVIGMAVNSGLASSNSGLSNPSGKHRQGQQGVPFGRVRQAADVHGPHDPWDDCTPPTQELVPMELYPKESWRGRAAEFLNALVDATGVKPEGCATAAVGCMSATFQHSFSVTGLPSKPIPTSTFTIWIADTSARKSTAWEAAFEGHRRADNWLHQRWKTAEETFNRTKEKRGGGGRARNPLDGLGGDPPQAPTPKKPLLMGRDSTVEAIGVRLQGGREDLVIENDEGATFTKNWSGGGAQRARSFAAFSTLWSGGILDDDRTSGGGREVYVYGGSLSLCLSIQGDYGLEWVLSSEAANGFSARTLIAYSEDCEPADDSPQRGAALAALREIHARVEAYRSRLDAGLEYKRSQATDKVKTPITLTPEALGSLRDIYVLNRAMARSMPKGHTSGFYRRIPEHVTRLAALWRLWDAFCEAQPGEPPPPDISVDDETLRGAAEVVAWHGREIQRLGGSRGHDRPDGSMRVGPADCQDQSLRRRESCARTRAAAPRAVQEQCGIEGQGHCRASALKLHPAAEGGARKAPNCPSS